MTTTLWTPQQQGTVKALTLWQPWASLIALGVKAIETRDWAPVMALDYLAIHASRRVVKPSYLPKRERNAIASHLGPDWAGSVPLGAIVAVARLVVVGRVLGFERVGEHQHALMQGGRPGTARVSIPIDDFGDFGIGRCLWLLDEIRPLHEPMPCVGHQGLWNAPPIMEEQLMEPIFTEWHGLVPGC